MSVAAIALQMLLSGDDLFGGSETLVNYRNVHHFTKWYTHPSHAATLPPTRQRMAFKFGPHVIIERVCRDASEREPLMRLQEGKSNYEFKSSKEFACAAQQPFSPL
jgi:hypothetical protein